MQTEHKEWWRKNLRERSLTIAGGGYYFKSEGPKAQVDSPKILPPPKMCAQKIVTLPCNNILSVRMLRRENPYERNFEAIISLELKKVLLFTIFTKPNASPSKENH